MSKIAILDTDFISKSHIVRTSEDDHLADRVLTVPGYNFYCHEQTTVELGRHFSKSTRIAYIKTESHRPHYLSENPFHLSKTFLQYLNSSTSRFSAGIKPLHPL